MLKLKRALSKRKLGRNKYTYLKLNKKDAIIISFCWLTTYDNIPLVKRSTLSGFDTIFCPVLEQGIFFRAGRLQFHKKATFLQVAFRLIRTGLIYCC